VMVSMCDPFDPEVPFFRREEFMRLVAATPALTWLLLTKRPEHVVARFDGWTGTWVWPRNAWLGFSAENQRCLEERQVAVSRTLDRIEGRPPIVFASLAPMLSPIDVSKLYLVDWVIVEAESGAAGRPGRPFDEAWARTVRDDCVARGTPFFYKQGVSGGRIVEVPQLDGEQWVQIPEVSR